MNVTKADLKKRLGLYFSEVEAVQSQVMELFRAQQVQLAAADPGAIEELARQQAVAIEPLQRLIEERTELLQQAKTIGIPAETLQQLAAHLDGSEASFSAKAQQLAGSMIALQHASRTLWITCQKSLLHYGQLVQLIANGGRKSLNSTGKPHNPGGAILDASV